jgi:hypothetical protein
MAVAAEAGVAVADAAAGKLEVEGVENSGELGELGDAAVAAEAEAVDTAAAAADFHKHPVDTPDSA